MYCVLGIGLKMVQLTEMCRKFIVLITNICSFLTK